MKMQSIKQEARFENEYTVRMQILIRIPEWTHRHQIQEVKKFLKIMVYLKRLRKVYRSASVHITLTRNADPDQNFHSDTDPDRLHKTMRIRNCTAGLVRNSGNFVRV